MTKSLQKIEATPPTVSTDPAYVEFDAFVKQCEHFATYCKQLTDAYETFDYLTELTSQKLADVEALIKRRNRASVAKWADSIRAGRAIYESDNLFEPIGRDEYPRRLKRSFIAHQVALLLGSFSNCGSHNPEVYTAMLVDEVYAAQFDSAIVIEIAFRKWRREQEWIPSSPAQLLKAIRIEVERWNNTARFDMRLDADAGYDENVLSWFDDVQTLLTRWKEKTSVAGFDWKTFKVEQEVTETLKCATKWLQSTDPKIERVHRCANDLRRVRMAIFGLAPELKQQQIWVERVEQISKLGKEAEALLQKLHGRATSRIA